jgi:isopentenyl diphosphate isomerase/L-lactate dehydrogenase-like FMN-dependent dehydrogenase
MLLLSRKCRAFQEVVLRPRHALANEKCNLRTRVVGQEISFPAILAPVGYSRLMHTGGEVAAARAAGESGTAFILSTISGHKMERVKQASSGPVWYQLYVVGGRVAAEAAIERASLAGFSALVVTIATPVARLREHDVRNGVKELMRHCEGDCMGARAVLLGRACAYGPGAAGQAGVRRALEILPTNMERTMRLLGCASVAELNPSLVEVPDCWLISGPD